MMNPPIVFILDLKLQIGKFLFCLSNLFLEKNLETEGWLRDYEQQTVLISTLAASGLLFFLSGTLFFLFAKKRFQKSLQLKFIEVRENERKKIAKSLHDELAGDIHILHNKLKRNNLIEESKELQKVKENVRSLSHQLTSVSFNDIPFKDQIKNFISDYLDGGLNLTVQGLNDIDWKKLNTSLKRVLYLTLREGIYNVEKHARADNVLISFSIQEKQVHLSISDDGNGFNPTNILGGIGLKNIQDRVEEIKGSFSIKSEPNQGTDLYIQTPIYD